MKNTPFSVGDSVVAFSAMLALVACSEVSISLDDSDRSRPIRGDGTCAPSDCVDVGMPNWLCDDGVTVAGPGECLPTDDGGCAVEIVECPVPTVDECAPEDCVDVGMPNWLCDDGVTVAGPGECLPTDDGGCAVEIVECPDTPTSVCDEAACGPEPQVDMICPNDMSVVFECVDDDNGCGWTWYCPQRG